MLRTPLSRDDVTVIAARAAADLVFLLAWLAGGIILATWNQGEVVLNTDSSAPITQLLLLTQGRVDSLQELRLARIPSFLPDLLILRAGLGLQWMDGPETIELLLAWYSILIGSLLLALQGALIFLTTPLSRWWAWVVTVLGTSVLVQVSPLYREAIGLTQTPVHHGGNVFNTLLLLVLMALMVRSRSLLRSRLAAAALVALAFIGTLSNVLLLFTAVAPVGMGLVLILLSSSGVSREAGRMDPVQGWLRGQMGPLLASLLGAALLGVVAARSFNLQCGFNLGVFPDSNLLAEYRDSPLVLLATALGLLLLFRATTSLGPVALAVALSALSPHAYSWFLPDTPRRYFLTLPLLMLVMIAMLVFPAAGAPASPLATTGRRSVLGAVLALLLALPMAWALLRVASPPLAARFQSRYDPADGVMLERLASLGHHRGLSDFWGAHLTAVSRGSVEVLPIDSDGEPDLWAHNREAFLSASAQPLDAPLSERLGTFSFVYLRVDEEQPSLIKAKDVLAAYGPPSGRLGCREDGSGPCVLLYANSDNLREVVAGKLATFRNRCREGNLR